MCDKLLLTVPEAAYRVGLGRSKLYQFMKSGELRSVAIDGARRIAPDDLAAFVELRKTKEYRPRPKRRKEGVESNDAKSS